MTKELKCESAKLTFDPEELRIAVVLRCKEIPSEAKEVLRKITLGNKGLIEFKLVEPLPSDSAMDVAVICGDSKNDQDL